MFKETRNNSCFSVSVICVDVVIILSFLSDKLYPTSLSIWFIYCRGDVGISVCKLNKPVINTDFVNAH